MGPLLGGLNLLKKYVKLSVKLTLTFTLKLSDIFSLKLLLDFSLGNLYCLKTLSFNQTIKAQIKSWINLFSLGSCRKRVRWCTTQKNRDGLLILKSGEDVRLDPLLSLTIQIFGLVQPQMKFNWRILENPKLIHKNTSSCQCARGLTFESGFT